MVAHLMPEQVAKAVIADLSSRIAEMGRKRPDKVDDAVAILRALPEMEAETELEIIWYSELDPPQSATLNLRSGHLSLSVSDAAGSQDIYTCEAGFHPEIDRSDFGAWLHTLRTLDAPEICISIWR